MTGICRTALLAHPIRVTPDRVEAYRVELPPGQAAGLHTHPGPVTGYVERGRIAFERDGQLMRELRPGDVFFEPAGEIIRRFDNLSGTEAATFIAFYLPSGDQPLIRLIQQGELPCPSSASTRCVPARPGSTHSAARSTKP